MKKPVDDVHAGQIWRDADPRMWSGNRRVRVEMTSNENLTGYVYYRQVIGPNNTVDGFSRLFRSRYERFQKAFVLIQQRPTHEYA